jgi:transcriptional regulator with XRE-family HTH domain
MSIFLRHWRERRGYSVRELGRRAGISYVTIVRIENDHTSPTVAMLEKLAQALGIRVRDFFPTAKPGIQRTGRRT